jgi:hypothetical protein
MRAFRPKKDIYNDNGIIFVYNYGTVHEQVISSLDEVEIGDYVSYPLDVKNSWEYFEFLTKLPEEVAKEWFEVRKIDMVNKYMTIVEIGRNYATAIYMHDFSYTLYRVKMGRD